MTAQKLGVRRDGQTVNLIVMAAGMVVPLTAQEARSIGETLVLLAGAAEMGDEPNTRWDQPTSKLEAALPVAA